MLRRLHRLTRTSAFRQSILYFALLALTAGGFFAYVGWQTGVSMQRQIVETVDAEVRGLAEQYRAGGIRTLVNVVEQRSRNPDNSIYLITSFRGQPIAGNIAALPPLILDEPGLHTLDYGRLGAAETSRAVVQVFILPGDFRLVVGRDTSERDGFMNILIRASFWAGGLVLLLGIGGGYLIARRTLSRIDDVSETSLRIMAGDMSGRIALDGSGDEFDRLATNLNSMLDRIARLMAGMREVSDNVAHDLRTPLTRLRGRIEAALRDGDPPMMQRALEDALADSEQLIATFNALLTIARAEAGGGDGAREIVDLTGLMAEIVELYEPLAEDEGASLVIADGPPASVAGNRELLAQALSNLIENAIRYGRPVDPGERAQITVSAVTSEARILLCVADHGQGIPAAQRARALERFVRLEPSRSQSGAGLGLSLVAAVAALHGGTVKLEDNDPGLRVTLDLTPAQKTHHEPEKTTH